MSEIKLVFDKLSCYICMTINSGKVMWFRNSELKYKLNQVFNFWVVRGSIFFFFFCAVGVRGATIFVRGPTNFCLLTEEKLINFGRSPHTRFQNLKKKVGPRTHVIRIWSEKSGPLTSNI
jgi:hypothetical protein